METGISIAAKIPAKPNPVFGIPILNKIGGITVPKRPKMIPNYRKIIQSKCSQI